MKKIILTLILLIIACTYFEFILGQNNRQKQNKMDMNQERYQYEDELKNLVVTLRRKGIKDEQVLSAIAEIPRHLFVTERLSPNAYDDKPLPIGKNQTISQPFTVAFQTELLQLKSGDKVLEIGTGSGYQAAVLCEMGMEVYSIEPHYQLHLQAKDVLNSLGYHPMLFYGDGYKGLPEHAPFDKILITAATKEFPPKLLEQLKIGGLMVAPIGDNKSQIMTVIKRLNTDKYEEKEYGLFTFVPMLEGVEK